MKSLSSKLLILAGLFLWGQNAFANCQDLLKAEETINAIERGFDEEHAHFQPERPTNVKDADRLLPPEWRLHPRRKWERELILSTAEDFLRQGKLLPQFLIYDFDCEIKWAQNLCLSVQRWLEMQGPHFRPEVWDFNQRQLSKKMVPELNDLPEHLAIEVYELYSPEEHYVFRPLSQSNLRHIRKALVAQAFYNALDVPTLKSRIISESGQLGMLTTWAPGEIGNPKKVEKLDDQAVVRMEIVEYLIGNGDVRPKNFSVHNGIPYVFDWDHALFAFFPSQYIYRIDGYFAYAPPREIPPDIAEKITTFDLNTIHPILEANLTEEEIIPIEFRLAILKKLTH